MNGEDGKSCSWLKWGMRLTWHKLRDGFKDNDWSSFLWLESWLPFPGLQSPLLVLLSVTPDSILESLPGKEWQTRSWVIEEKKKKNKISIGLLWVTSAGSLFFSRTASSSITYWLSDFFVVASVNVYNYTCLGWSSSWSLCCLQRVTLYHLASDDELLSGAFKCDRRKASYWTWEETEV